MSVLHAKSRVVHMEDHDNFANQVRQLVVLKQHMEEDVDWKDSETIICALVNMDEIMVNDDLDVMMDPSHELRQSNEDMIKADYRKEEEECLRMYGKDQQIHQMICKETTEDLDRCMERLDMGDFIRAQLEVMSGLWEAHQFYDARRVCVWIFAQNGRYGVWYDEHLLQILKDFLGDVNDKLEVFSESRLELNLTFK